MAHRYGQQMNDQIVLDTIFTTGDNNNISDGTYNGVLTGNNWTSPGAVFIGHGLYLLLPHGNVVNRFVAAVIDIQNLGYGMQAASLQVHKDLVPNKLKAKVGGGVGYATQDRRRHGQPDRHRAEPQPALDHARVHGPRTARGLPVAGRLLRLVPWSTAASSSGRTIPGPSSPPSSGSGSKEGNHALLKIQIADGR